MAIKLERILTNPEEITPAYLECVVMPNGEVISCGESIGWVKTNKNSERTPLGRFLVPASEILRLQDEKAELTKKVEEMSQ